MSADVVFIVSAARTPMGSLNGGLSSLKASDLGARVISEVLKRAEVSPDDVSDVIMGQVLTAGAGQNPVRQASVEAGIPYSTPAMGVSFVCGSGLRSVIAGSQAIRCGDAKVVVAGGMESMSGAPHSVHMRNGVKFGHGSLIDTMLTDGLTDAFSNIHMGITAENIAKLYAISREDQDHFAAESQRRAGIAVASGHFDSELIPLDVTRSGRHVSTVTKDEQPRPETTFDTLSKLRPAFLRDGSGTVTAGNSSTINDGAAAVLLMSAEEAGRRGLKGLGKIVSSGLAGVDPAVMGTGPIPAIRKALDKAGWSVDDVDLFELNEAFAVQALAVIRTLGLDPSKVNINGGAIALGHPIGASACRVLVTLLYALQRTGKKKGCAALCVGGGMGVALCIEATS